jgi:hypothetical protein
MALESLIHFADRPAMLHRVARLLRPGGRIALTDVLVRGVPDPAALDDPDRAAVTCFMQQNVVPSLVKTGDYARWLSDAGLTLIEELDLTERTKRTFLYVRDQALAGVERRTAENADDPVVPHLRAGAELCDRLARIPEFGYVLVIAQR